ncbi:MAG: XdhC family protein [Candidatus Hydrogenedentes bacterium]|nr:XdhC family protein [Candidatus Hydrogenedentota bacterium]
MGILTRAVELIDKGQAFAVAVVIRAAGSTPQKAGARALFTAEGAIHGTLGGGCLEAESRRRALDALDEGKAFCFDLNLDDDYGWDDGLICGGRVRVFVDPRPARHRSVYEQAIAAVGAGKRGVLLTRISGAPDHIGATEWREEGQFAQPDAPVPTAQLVQCLSGGEPALVEATGTWYLEPIEPSPTLIIAGGGHVGQATARLAHRLGFAVVVVDDRPAFAEAALYPEGVRTICADIPAAVAGFPITPATYILIVTRGHRHDGVVLKACIHSSAAYIGMIGSRRKVHIIRKGFLEEGIATEADFKRVYSPVGLDIGALTIEEIAVSIASQLVAVRRHHAGAAKSLAEFVSP